MKKTEKSPSLMRGTRFLILSASRPLRNKTAVRVCKKASLRNALRPSAARTSTSRALLAARHPPLFSHPSSGRPGPADRPRPVRSLRPSLRALPPRPDATRGLSAAPPPSPDAETSSFPGVPTVFAVPADFAASVLFPGRLAFARKLGYPDSMQHDRRILRIFFVMMAERHWRSHL